VQGKKIHVLLIDDDPVDADLTERALSQVGEPGFEVIRAGSLAEAEQRLRESEFDVALLDLGLPDSERDETLACFRTNSGGKLPIVILTGLANDITALDSLDHGAQDYLSKDDIASELLARSIRYALQRHQLVGQIESANEELERKNGRLAQLYDTAQQFVENVSHEFRTPLTVIREFSSIIRDGLDGPVTPRQVEHLEKILHRTDDLALMVDDMLDISKLEAGLLGAWRRPASVVDLLESVREFLNSRAASKGISLEVTAEADLPQVYCDEEKARRVLINLAVNAIKFTPDGGEVRLWAAARDGTGVTVGVTDTGPGISQENREIIFDRFQQVDVGLTTSVKGFGLGLNIAKELVGLNLGRIDVTSRPGAPGARGVGTTFSFTLPVNEPRSIFERYLERLESLGRSAATVSLLTVETDPRGDPSAAPVVDEFLQRSIRVHDLVVQYSAKSWIIAAACLESSVVRMIGRLTAEWTNFVRNFPNSPLPQLEIAYCSAWSIGDQRSELTEMFVSLATNGVHQSASRRKILVVDDDREVSQCLSVRLQSAGYDVVSAADGEAGLAAAFEHHPDAVVLDVRMPKKDGLAVLKEIRADESLKNTPIVMLSASIRDQHQALEAGASYFVPKPYEARQVLTAIESSMREEVVA
jgi:hypothetical protein